MVSSGASRTRSSSEVWSITSVNAPNGDSSQAPTTIRSPDPVPAPAMCPVKTRRTVLSGFRAGLAQRLEFLVGEPDLGGGHILFQVAHLRRAGDRQHHRRTFQQPGKGEL